MECEAELPKNHVKRIVKSKLAELLGEEAGDNRKQLALNKDALLAFSESARVFVWYVTSTANDICRQSKRQTVGAEDVLRALRDLEFGEFVPSLKEALEDFKKDNKEKNRKKQEQLKKRKVERTTPGGADAPENVEKDAQDEPGAQHDGVKRSKPLDEEELMDSGEQERVKGEDKEEKEDDKEEEEEEEEEVGDDAMDDQEKEQGENMEGVQGAEDSARKEET